MAQFPLIIAIDGTGHAGKDQLAEKLAFHHFAGKNTKIINAGNYTRYLTGLALRQNLDWSDEAALKAFVERHFPANRYDDISRQDIFTPKIGNNTKHLVPVMRLSELIREDILGMIDKNDHDIYLVLSRNAGTYIVPQAQAKLYLQASDETILHRLKTPHENIIERNRSDIYLPANTMLRDDTAYIDTNGKTSTQVYQESVAVLQKVKTGNFVVTIDGPGGSGKDTLAANLKASGVFGDAKVHTINIGNYIRYLARIGLERGVDLTNPIYAHQMVSEGFKGGLTYTHIREDETLYTHDVTALSPYIARTQVVYDHIGIDLQKIMSRYSENVFLILGRQAGSYLLPHAHQKYYLDASPEILAQRKGQAVLTRNRLDRKIIGSEFERFDTCFIDTSELTSSEVFDKAAPTIRSGYREWRCGL